MSASDNWIHWQGGSKVDSGWSISRNSNTLRRARRKQRGDAALRNTSDYRNVDTAIRIDIGNGNLAIERKCVGIRIETIIRKLRGNADYGVPLP